LINGIGYISEKLLGTARQTTVDKINANLIALKQQSSNEFDQIVSLVRQHQSVMEIQDNNLNTIRTELHDQH
jgi:hypothetical protein